MKEEEEVGAAGRPRPGGGAGERLGAEARFAVFATMRLGGGCGAGGGRSCSPCVLCSCCLWWVRSGPWDPDPVERHLLRSGPPPGVPALSALARSRGTGQVTQIPRVCPFLSQARSECLPAAAQLCSCQGVKKRNRPSPGSRAAAVGAPDWAGLREWPGLHTRSLRLLVEVSGSSQGTVAVVCVEGSPWSLAGLDHAVGPVPSPARVLCENL